MNQDEEKIFSEFIEKHKDKLKAVDEESLAKSPEEVKWLRLYRLFSDKTKDNFRQKVSIKSGGG